MMVSDDDISVRKINRICEGVRLLTEDEFQAATSMANKQIAYINLLKPQKQEYFNDLGEYNQKVIAALRELQSVIKSKK